MIAGIGDLEWREATNKAGGANNPNRLWPVAVSGFDALLQRKTAQVLFTAQATIVLQCICDSMTVATNALAAARCPMAMQCTTCVAPSSDVASCVVYTKHMPQQRNVVQRFMMTQEMNNM